MAHFSGMEKHTAAARFEQRAARSLSMAQDIVSTSRDGCLCCRVERWDDQRSVEVWLSHSQNSAVTVAASG